jgi:hypothetical protein
MYATAQQAAILRAAGNSELLELPARFISKIEIDEDGCWVWTGSRQHRGYGMVRIGSRNRSTGRPHPSVEPGR